ncbi:hypothetical protein PAXRUDRAFT_45521, partial [Paxillus rubicundulus Ve08.2h10]
GRSWTPAHSDTSLLGSCTHRRPDIVCYETECKKCDWRLLHTVLELKSGALSHSNIFTVMAKWAKTIFMCQDNRRFVLVLLLHKYELSLALFDRGGSIIADPFDIHDKPELFLHILFGITYAKEEYLSYDTHIATLSSDRYLVHAHLHLELLFTTFISDRIHGHGTVVWLAKATTGSYKQEKEKENLYVVVKTTWQDDNNPLTEGVILYILEKKGVKGIPTLIHE